MGMEELKEYLGIVVDMEQSVYLQKSLRSNIEQEIERLKVPKKINDPVEPIPLTRPVCPANPPHGKRHSVFGIIAGCIGLFFVVGLGSTIVLTYCAYFVNVPPSEFSWMACSALLAPIIWLFYCVTSNERETKNYWEKRNANDKKYRENMQEYLEQSQLEMEQYQEAVKEIQQLRQQDKIERQLKTIFLEKQKEEIENCLAISEKYRQTIYEKGIIFPKYRNLVMVCSLYEYICAGRCTELEGAEGAYNILEIEIRLDRIILQLDEVINKLEKIKNSQYALYSAVQETNRRLSQICGSISGMSARLDDFYNNSIQLSGQMAGLNAQNAELNAHIIELQKTSELAAYHTERTQKELAYMNRMDYLSGRNDDVFFNHPPV